MDVNKIKRYIDNYEIISFDIFDTLLKRNVSSPLNIFDLVEKEYNSKFSPNIKNFKKNRIFVQKKLRQMNLKSDYNFDDLYNELSEFYSKQEIERLKKLEKEIEKRNLTKNIVIYDLFNYCKELNKKIICVSDMYFDSKFLSNILEKCGYNGIDEIFVSSEYNATKSNGNLYYIVRKKYNSKKILHTGDSKKSDLINARIKGIKSIKIPTIINYLNYSNNNSNKELTCFMNNYYLYNKSDIFNLGFELYGPVLFGFMKWVDENIKIIKPQNIYFFARDTKIVYDYYENIDCKKHYVYISRKSIRGAYLYLFHSYNEIQDLISIDNMKFEQFLKLLNLNLELVLDEANKFDLSPKDNISLLDDSDKLSKFVETIEKKLVMVNKDSFNSLYKYLEQINYFEESGVIIDSGWNGTIQYCLNKMFPNNKKYGLYIGLEDKAYNRIEKKYIDAFLFGKDYDEDCKRAIVSIKQLFEISISETCGSTLSYTIKDDKAYPVLENKSNDYGFFVDELQKGIRYFFEVCKNMNYEYEKKEYFSYLNKFIVKPKLKHVKIFLDFSTNNLEQQLNYKCNEESILYYICHFKKFINNLKTSPWKVGFLKMVFKFDLPYYKIYSKIKERI